MKVLIIAPHFPDLKKVSDEVAGLANSLSSVILQGSVVKNDIVNAIAKEGTFEGFWFASHAGASGVRLSDDEVFSPYDVASYANVAQCEWVVLNTCSARGMVSTIQILSDVDVVATESEDINDPAAWQFARLLALAFARGGNMRDAVRTVSPDESVHRFYQNGRRMVRQYTGAKLTPVGPLPEQSLEEKLDLLMGWVNGDERRGVRGLREQNEKILGRLEAIEEQLEGANAERNSLSAKLATVQTFLIIVGVGVMAVAVAIIWLFALRMAA